MTDRLDPEHYDTEVSHGEAHGSLVRGATPPPAPEPPAPEPDLRTELTSLLNRHSRENSSDTPDFILAEFLLQALEGFETTVRARDRWYGFDPGSHFSPLQSETRPVPPTLAFENPPGENPDALEHTRRFFLNRHVEHSPHSAGGGVGIIAVGVEFPDQTVALRWLTGGGSTAVWPNAESVRLTHCHKDSPTDFIWID